MTNPYTAPPASGPAPRWARKRYVLPALCLALALGASVGGSDDGKKTEAQALFASPRPTVTVTATTTRTAEAEPAPTVTATKTVEVEVTETESQKKHLFKAGDAIGLTSGMHITWVSKGPFSKKLWVITRDEQPKD